MKTEDLVKRLRREGENAMRKHLSMGMHDLCSEAADALEAKGREIDALEQQIKDLRQERSENEAEIERLRRKAGE